MLRDSFVTTFTFLLATLLLACSSEVPDGPDDGGLEDALDGAADTMDDGGCTVICGTDCCEEGERCFRDGCIPDNGVCGDGDVCLNDTACVDGVCLPFGVGPLGDWDAACVRVPEPLDSFDPEIQCEWPGDFEIDFPHITMVFSQPLVGDLDSDGIPEIVFTSVERWHASSAVIALDARIRAIRGDDCSPVWTSNEPNAIFEGPALADLTGDGRLEVCGRGPWFNGAGSCIPYCLSNDGDWLWEGRDADGLPVGVGCHFYWQVGIAVTNIDGEGPPEVVVGATAFDGVTGLLRRALALPTWGMYSSIVPALADIDEDGHVEALIGGMVFDLVTGEEEVWSESAGHGYTAVADLSAEHPGPEVVVVSNGFGQIRVHASDDGSELYSYFFPVEVLYSSGGPPAVADLDGDGQAEFVAASNYYLMAFDLDCVGSDADPPDPERCVADDRTDGVMWEVETRDASSGITGISVFDFEGDGPVEVVYADECWVRVFDGSTGEVKFSAPHFNGTFAEYSVVADVDGDFHTELVVPHNDFPQDYPFDPTCPDEDPLMPGVRRDPDRYYTGITVYRDREDRWAPSRSLWSQHAEHWSNRFDDGTVPAMEVPSWTTHNSYRQALPREGGTAIDIPDLTVSGIEAEPCDTENQRQPLSARVCNRGTLPVAAGVDVSFRIDSTTGEVACDTRTHETLEPGHCEVVECVWEGVPINEPHEIHVVVDPEDSDSITECHEDNNTTAFDVRCPPFLG